MATLDQTGDTSLRELYRYSKLYSFPEYVKQASHSQTCRPDEKLPSTVFADVRYRRFPCHTKAATWLSYLYFLEKKADLHTKIAGWIEERLDQFAQYWGLSGDIQKLREKHAELHREDPLSDSDYMLVWAGEDGRKERHYPLVDTLSVKKAAEWFAKYRYHWPFEDRVVMASKILEKAAQYGCGLGEELDELLQKQAGRGCYDPKTAAEHIRNRVKIADRVPREIRERMLKLAEAVETAPAMAQDPERAKMLAKTIDDFDKLAHISGKYTPRIPSPEDIVFPATWKVARAFVDTGCVLTTGSVYDRNDFSKLALSDVRDLFGDDLAKEVADGLAVDPEKMAEVAATLPRAEARLLDRLLSDNGIAPVVKQATATTSFSTKELRELAKINQFVRGAP